MTAILLRVISAVFMHVQNPAYPRPKIVRDRILRVSEKMRETTYRQSRKPGRRHLPFLQEDRPPRDQRRPSWRRPESRQRQRGGQHPWSTPRSRPKGSDPGRLRRRQDKWGSAGQSGCSTPFAERESEKHWVPEDNSVFGARAAQGSTERRRDSHPRTPPRDQTFFSACDIVSPRCEAI